MVGLLRCRSRVYARAWSDDERGEAALAPELADELVELVLQRERVVRPAARVGVRRAAQEARDVTLDAARHRPGRGIAAEHVGDAEHRHEDVRARPGRL